MKRTIPLRHQPADAAYILTLVACGYNTRYVATALGWSETEVANALHYWSLLLGARNRTHLVVRALGLGIIAQPSAALWQRALRREEAAA